MVDDDYYLNGHTQLTQISKAKNVFALSSDTITSTSTRGHRSEVEAKLFETEGYAGVHLDRTTIHASEKNHHTSAAFVNAYGVDFDSPLTHFTAPEVALRHAREYSQT